jgi:hypothetical protein
MPTLDDLRGAFTLLEQEAVSHNVMADDTTEILGRVRQPRPSRRRRWRVATVALGVVLVAGVVTTAVLTTRSPSHEATKHSPFRGPNFTVTLSLNGQTRPPSAHATTLAVGREVNFRVQIHGPADVRVHNVYLFLGGARYGLGPGEQPSGHAHILTHILGTLPPKQAITANWTAMRLFGSSRLTLAVQFDFDFPIRQQAREQSGILDITVI